MNASLSSPKLAPIRRPVLSFEPTRARGDRPRLTCSIAPAINVHVEAAHRHTVAWAIETKLVRARGPTLARLRAARFTWLAARAHPAVSPDQLALISDWITFLFFYDDLCDTQRATEPGYVETLVAAEERLMAIGRGATPHTDDIPLALALADIRARAAAIAHQGWLERLGRHLEEYIVGCRWERIIRHEGRVPSLATYSRLRLLISAVPPCFDFAGMCIDGTRTSFADEVLVQQLEVMANNYICWVNDIYGVDKEIAENTTSNLVVVLAHQLGVGWEDALGRAIEMCNAELDAFLSLRQQMAQLGDPSCRRYIQALESWMRGNLDWYSETLRYGSNGAT